MKTILAIIRQRRIWWSVVGSLLLTTTLYFAVVTPRVVQEIRDRATAERAHEELLQKLDHGTPLKGPGIRLAIAGFEFEKGALRVARIQRVSEAPDSVKMFVEGTTESMDSAFRSYLSEIAKGAGDKGFWYSALGVKGERIKVITALASGQERTTFYTVDAVSLPPPPQEEVFGLGRILRGLPGN